MKRAIRSFEYWALHYRRTWRGTAVSSILSPVLYLAAMGVGLGSLVTANATRQLGGSYLAFVAPGLLAATAMQTASTESSYPVLSSLKWAKTYYKPGTPIYHEIAFDQQTSSP